jgi:hypothetical protein
MGDALGDDNLIDRTAGRKVVEQSPINVPVAILSTPPIMCLSIRRKPRGVPKFANGGVVSAIRRDCCPSLLDGLT